MLCLYSTALSHILLRYCLKFLGICPKLNQYTMAVDGNWSGGIKDLTNFIVDFNNHKNCNWRFICPGRISTNDYTVYTFNNCLSVIC